VRVVSMTTSYHQQRMETPEVPQESCPFDQVVSERILRDMLNPRTEKFAPL